MTTEARVSKVGPALPKGPHRLSRAEVAQSQRSRLMAALTELLAEGGYESVTIGALAAKAGVSRGAFYAHFADKEACLLAAYDEFSAELLAAMAAVLTDDTPWEDEFVGRALHAYLAGLERDPVGARAFIIEMDGAGDAARQARRKGPQAFAAVMADRYAAMRRNDPRFGPFPDRAFLGLAFAVRDLVREELEDSKQPTLTDLEPDILALITAAIRGARSLDK